jgi:hypothetical protein
MTRTPLLGVRMGRDRVVEYAALALLAVVVAIIAYANMLF